MKKTTLLFLFALVCGASAASALPVAVAHTETGALASELSAVLEAKDLTSADVTELIVTGEVSLNADDCSAIASLKSTLVRLDLSGAVFADNTVPATAKENAGIFNGMIALEECILPESITAIGNGAFVNCKKLVKINIPTKVTVIPKYCFTNCEKLSDITLPEGLETLNGYCFKNCKALKLATLPSTVEIIREEVFNGSPVTFSELPAGLTTLGNNSLSSTKVTLTDLPKNLTKLGNATFSGSTVRFKALPPQLTQIGIKLFANVNTMTEFEITDQAGLWTNIPNGTFFLDTQIDRTFVCRSPEPPVALVSDVSLSATNCGAFGKIAEYPMITFRVPVASIEKYQQTAPYSTMNLQALTLPVEWPEIITPVGVECVKVVYVVADKEHSDPAEEVYEGQGNMVVSFLDDAPDHYYIKEIRTLSPVALLNDAEGGENSEGESEADDNLVYSCPDIDACLKQSVSVPVDVKPGISRYSILVDTQGGTSTGIDDVSNFVPVRRGDIIELGEYGGSLYDIAGRKVASVVEGAISLEALPDGVYILRTAGTAQKIVK